MFAYDLPAPKKMMKAKCTCGNDSCKNAKKIKCACRCHSEFHGAGNRRGMEPLDKALALDMVVDLGFYRQGDIGSQHGLPFSVSEVKELTLSLGPPADLLSWPKLRRLQSQP